MPRKLRHDAEPPRARADGASAAAKALVEGRWEADNAGVAARAFQPWAWQQCRGECDPRGGPDETALMRGPFAHMKGAAAGPGGAAAARREPPPPPS